ncbi:hypothetical protein [Streptomyces osmaniensis]|uniref:Uncharacterized protein n=1 Tax=Streptomyces osmaniensis TaxID=593134 RepID=A0ABP6Z4Y7_9ACTN
MSGPKPFEISKHVLHVLWEAYLRVKANRGAAGVDGESIEQFEADLQGNLYKLWNRMSSGSYFPPPVRMVEILKSSFPLVDQGFRIRRGAVVQSSLISVPREAVPWCLEGCAQMWSIVDDAERAQWNFVPFETVARFGSA